MLHGWCYKKPLPSRRILCTPYNHVPCHFMQSHIRKVHACSAVTCHPHFWQNDPDLSRATAVTRGWNGYRNRKTCRVGGSKHDQVKENETKNNISKLIVLPLYDKNMGGKYWQNEVRLRRHRFPSTRHLLRYVMTVSKFGPTVRSENYFKTEKYTLIC